MSSEAEPVQTPTGRLELPGLIVDPSWLAERLGEPGVRAVDLRDLDAYRSGRIPGAAHLDLSELGSTVGGHDNVLVSADEFGRLMSVRGISNRDRIVAYDNQWGLAAARLVWALHRYGHQEAAVLDGGWDRWKEEGWPTASGEMAGDEATSEGSAGREHPSGDSGDVPFEASPSADVHAETEWLAGRIESGDVAVVDSRTPAEFEQGHLPGALSWDWFNAVPAGSWDASREPDELRAEWRGLGLDPSDEVTVYCRSGMRAAHTWLVLRNAGFARVRLYDGSWQEWSTTMESSDEG